MYADAASAAEGGFGEQAVGPLSAHGFGVIADAGGCSTHSLDTIQTTVSSFKFPLHLSQTCPVLHLSFSLIATCIT